MPPEEDPSGQPGTPSGELLAGRYRLGELIGQGGMGRVWQGTDELLGRDVAVKELTFPPGLGSTERAELRVRMLREARTAAKLSHPSIVTIYDVTEVDERPWIIMELVRAVSLSDMIREQGSVPAERLARYALQLLDALAVAHARGVVHRDVKPGNVLIAPNGRVVLTDFGIAVLDGDSTLTRTGVLVGSPAYLAPEVARGEPARPPADLWSLGTTIYAALTGRSPFQRDGPLATLTAIISEDPPVPPSAGPLRPVLEGLLRKEPRERMTGATASQILRAVVSPRAASGGPTEPPASGAASPPSEVSSGDPAGRAALDRPGRRRSRRGVMTLAAVTVAVIVLGTGLGLFAASQAREESGSTTVADVEESPDAPAEESAGPSPEETGPPEGMRLHEDPTGFSLHVPESWEMETQGSSVYFHNPAGGYLQVDQTDDPGDDALEDWENLEGAISGNFPGYQRVTMDYVEHPNLERYITAADWEFTYTSGEHGAMRAVNRGFHTESKGYALFFTGPEGEWEATNRELLDEFTASFEPAG